MIIIISHFFLAQQQQLIFDGFDGQRQPVVCEEIEIIKWFIWRIIFRIDEALNYHPRGSLFRRTSIKNNKLLRGTTFYRLALHSSLPIIVDPFDKLINNDYLNYLPNLYLRQYRLIDELARIRHDFPEQNYLIPRPRTTHDTLLEDIAFSTRISQERKKLNIVLAATLAREAKAEVQKRELRKEEQYHFHRLTSGFLAEAVVEQFKKSADEGGMEIEESKVEKQNPKKNIDDIFMNEEEDEFNYVPQEPDLLDDLLAGDLAPNHQDDLPPPVTTQPISHILSQVYASRKQIIEQEPLLAVGRKASLKKINESVRRRLKFKEQEEENPGRSLSSATVFLSNLLATEPESKARLLSDPISTTDCLFGVDRSRKRKEGEEVELRWSQQVVEKMETRNERGLRRNKLDPGVLVVTAGVEEEEYRKVFQKQILGDKNFPPTLRNVEESAPRRRQKFYNEFHDTDYEWFVIRHNKNKLYEKFAEKAPLIFPENYAAEDFEDADNISAGKLFIHKPQEVLQRLVFLKEERQVRAYLRSQPKHSIDERRALLLAFLIEKYLKEFGNNWKNIAQLVCRHIAFAQKHLTVEFVQEIYQIVMRLTDSSNSIPNLQLWDKKVLPSSYGHAPSYTVFQPQGASSGSGRSLSPVDHGPSTEDETPITAEYYAQLVEEGVEEVEEKPYQALEESFKEFLKPIEANIPKMVTSSREEDLAEAIVKILEMYEDCSEEVEYDVEEQLSPNRQSSRNQLLGESLRGEIKVGAPFRKKKSINERNNELVKILQALRNKNLPNSAGQMQKKPDESIKQTTSAPLKVANTPQPSHLQKPETDLKKSMKSPDKPKLGAPKKDRKHKDHDDKK